VLIDDSVDCDEIKKELSDSGRNPYVVDSTICTNDVLEYDVLYNLIEAFSHSGSQVMIAKFSGKHNVLQEIGDEMPYMIIPISYNRSSNNYINSGFNILDLVSIFEKETINNAT
jgi:hypothetical protein